MFALLVWCLLSCYAGWLGERGLLAFGIGYALEQAGATVGYLLGSYLVMPAALQGAASITGCLVGAMIVLVLAMAIFPPHALNELIVVLPDKDETPMVNATQAGAWEEASMRVAQEAGLTAREREVMLLLARGRGGDHIAATLGVSVSTIYTHTHNIYHKLDVHSREELMRRVDAAAAPQPADVSYHAPAR